MEMSNKYLWLLVFILSFFIHTANPLVISCQASSSINYQGKLTDSGGTPVPDGSYTMIFRIYDDPTSTALVNKLWEESQTVTAQGGLYNVLLGSVTVFPAGLFSTDFLWLEVEVSAEVLTPRQSIASVPYSFRAATADGIADGSVTAEKIGEPCAEGEVLVKTASGWACGPVPCIPSAEICDGLDNDCNGTVDDGLTGAPCPLQAGVCVGSVQPCGGSMGFLPCSIQDYGPSYEFVEVTCDGKDNDCDGAMDEVDQDNDTHVATACGGDDCDDLRPLVFNGAPETCGDSLDNDCNGLVDDKDADSDGHIDASCIAYSGAFPVDDCNDGNTSIHPAIVESCDGMDNNCDGQADEGFNVGNPCTVGMGECQNGGILVCSPDGTVTVCDATFGTPDAEVCDGLDNNCNGTADEFWQTGGIYDSDQACGNCMTDCTQIFNKPNASGLCDSIGAPVCTMICDSGYFDTNGVSSDGCEFVIDPDAIYVSNTDPLASDVPGCGRAPVFTGPGNFPCLTIGAGLSEALGASRSQVFVASGAYPEDVILVPGINLLGGYNPNDWNRDWDTNPTVIRGTSGSGHRKTIAAMNISLPTRFQGFIVQGQNATTPGMNSYALYVVDSDSNLNILDNEIYAGNGAAGYQGADGADGQNGVDGSPGLGAAEVGNPACSVTRLGGLGGIRSCGASNVSGGDGGNAVCRPSQGTQSSGRDGTTAIGAGGGLGGSGGWDGGTSFLQDQCTTCLLPSAPGTMAGSDGAYGLDGTSGGSGAGCSLALGAVSANEWIGSLTSGGFPGSYGYGGGGGGAGGGGEDIDLNTCYDDLGGSGGGGGSGGCDGTGGGAGQTGGGSFAVFIVNATTAPVVSGNVIYLANGGNGGDGGNGGTGGAGGIGDSGGSNGVGQWDFCTGNGGRGGDGGAGGHGGGSGGSCGGVSYGVYINNFSGVPNYKSMNTFNLTGSGGSGGTGGGSLGIRGGDGSGGISAAANF